jgi:hypothetical protein
VTDPTLTTVDDEPWNKTPEEQRKVFDQVAPVLAIEDALSPAERAFRGLPVWAADGKRAQFVYELSGHTTSPQFCECDARCILTSWTEKEYAPDDAVAKQYGREYRVVRDVNLCNTCSNKLKALPLGERWKTK